MKYPGWQKFVELCEQAEQQDLTNELLKFFFTNEEQEQMGMRILLVQALVQGKLTQREIAKELGVSISKITRGSNMLKSSPKAIKAFLEDALQ